MNITVTDLYEIFADNYVSFLLPWKGWTGGYCCKHCISVALSEINYSMKYAHICEGIYFSNNKLEEGIPLKLFISYGLSGLNVPTESVRDVGKSIEQALLSHNILYQWNGEPDSTIIVLGVIADAELVEAQNKKKP